MDGSAGLVVDAGPLFAAVDDSDPAHEACATLLRTASGPFIVPTLAIGEVAHFIENRLSVDSELRFLGDFVLGNIFAEPVHPADWLRIAELVSRYRDLPLGLVDASVIAAAERLNIRRIATLDRRHFSVVRQAHVDSFELLPD